MISFIQTLVLTLLLGWNLVTAPQTTTPEAIVTSDPNHCISAIWEYDTETFLGTPVWRGYFPSQADTPLVANLHVIREGRAYWVFSNNNSPCSMSFIDGRVHAVQAVYGNTAPLVNSDAVIGEVLHAADAYGTDWRLLFAIASAESSLGRFACGGNAWGYDSCNTTFDSFAEGAAFVANMLANNPLYKELDTRGKLCMWVAGNASCPTVHSIEYADTVLFFMRLLDRALVGDYP